MNSRKYAAIVLGVVVSLITLSSHAQETVISLAQAKEMALENNKNIKRATQNIGAAEAARASAYTADKPFLEGKVAGLYLSNPLNVLLPEFSTNTILTMNQIVYAGGKINYAKKKTSSLLEIQHAQRELTVSEVILKTETAYWQLVNGKEKKVLAEGYIKLLNSLHSDLNNSYRAGLIYKNDILRVEVQLNQAELNLTKALNGITMATLNLAQITGLNNQNFTVKDDPSIAAEIIIATINSSDHRPEISMLKKAVEIQELQSRILNADRMPVIALSANGLFATGKNANFSNGNNYMKAFYGILSINIPIFDWGGRKQKVREQQFKASAQKLELEETRELINLEIQNCHLELKQSVRRLDLTKKSLLQAEENLRLNNDRFKAGTVIGKDVLEAQVLWQEALSSIIDAKADYKINEAKYKKSAGDLQ